MNTVIRKCKKCGYTKDQDGNFGYLGDGVWQCPHCLSKYTEIKEIMENKELSEKINGEDAPKYCPACQAVWKDNAQFCGYCGTKLEVYKAPS